MSRRVLGLSDLLLCIGQIVMFLPDVVSSLKEFGPVRPVHCTCMPRTETWGVALPAAPCLSNSLQEGHRTYSQASKPKSHDQCELMRETDQALEELLNQASLQHRPFPRN